MNEQSLKDRLLTLSKGKGVPFNECWKKLLLERFLARLSHSSQCERFIFKGGCLLAYIIEIGRETVDLDFLSTNFDTNEQSIKHAIEEILSVDSDDGFVFSYEAIKILEQPHMEYPGFRVSLRAAFEGMRDKIQIDIGIGDCVDPLMRTLTSFQYRSKSMFEGEISLLVYPVESIFAEKLETIISKGAINTRMKDYHDVVLLIRENNLMNLDKLRHAITDTFRNRATTFSLIAFEKQDIDALQKLWSAHLKNLGPTAQKLALPKDFKEVTLEINKTLISAKLNLS